MGTLPAVPNDGTRTSIFATRVRSILGVLAVMNPAIMVKVDIVRLSINTDNDYPDNQTEYLVSIAEDIDGFNLEHEDKFMQEGVGLIRTRVNWLIIPSGFGVEPDDQVIIKGVPYMITKAEEMSGVCRCTISQPKNRYARPIRGVTPTYRQIGMGCFIQ